MCLKLWNVFKEKWKNYLNSLEYEHSFIYKNETNYLLEFVDSYPAILYQNEDDVKVIAKNMK